MLVTDDVRQDPRFNATLNDYLEALSSKEVYDCCGQMRHTAATAMWADSTHCVLRTDGLIGDPLSSEYRPSAGMYHCFRMEGHDWIFMYSSDQIRCVPTDDGEVDERECEKTMGLLQSIHISKRMGTTMN